MWSEFRVVGLLNSQTHSTSKVWLIDHREDFTSCASPLYSLVNISFLDHRTLTNKAVGTLWQDLSKPLQRRQGPYPRPLWLLVETPLVLGPEFASRRAEHNHSGGYLYIFLIYCFYHLTCLYYNFYDLFVLVGCWSSAFIRRIIYKFWMYALLITLLLRLVGRLGSRKPV